MRFSLFCLFCVLAWPAWASVDLNQASQADLESLPGIGPVRALAIIEYRDKHGPFRRIEELRRIKGIGAKTVDALRDELTITPPTRRKSGKSP
jgi:competence protein ComEA